MNNYYAQNSQVFFHVTYRIQAKFGGFDHGFNSQECPCLFTYPQDLWIEIIMSVLCLPLYLYGKIYASGKCIQKPRPLLSFYSFYCLIVSYIYSMDFNNFQPAFLFLVLLTLALELFSTAPLLISHLLSLCDWVQYALSVGGSWFGTWVKTYLLLCHRRTWYSSLNNHQFPVVPLVWVNFLEPAPALWNMYVSNVVQVLCR